jgi:hypothetical protein
MILCFRVRDGKKITGGSLHAWATARIPTFRGGSDSRSFPLIVVAEFNP